MRAGQTGPSKGGIAFSVRFQQSTILTCQKAKNRRTSCMRHLGHPESLSNSQVRFSGPWPPASVASPWTAGRQRAAAMGLPAEGPAPVLNSSPLSRLVFRSPAAFTANDDLCLKHRRSGDTISELSTSWQLWANHSNKVSPRKRNAPGSAAPERSRRRR